ncbi:hypothetical protein A5844_000807 [Enterococcus sp. 10A9_DIV0425]|uniref:Zn-finger containing protein n=1 Tax=Candidatus Enterococcus wittei TaxID=1987383 RepID=A0A2C9XT40_9ENTE|nr:hypothetical protein [Enterococcus sp. 10A9_DIV0425]OTP12574.1 hypothetical protein A5844_000807 [Enterococcus sp. 10A9_DIV0425]
MGQIWLKRFLRFYTKYQQLMKGRYARIDQLNRLFLIFSLIAFLLKAWLPYSLGQILFLFFFFLVIYRFSSKKIYVRLNENQKYLKKTVEFKAWVAKYTKKKQKKNATQEYIFFACPACQQKQRAPKGRGRIRVTCKKCGNQFETDV